MGDSKQGSTTTQSWQMVLTNYYANCRVVISLVYIGRSEMKPSKKPFAFEQAIQSLEKIVGAIEAGDLTLEESLKQFEKGIALTRDCHQALTHAEQTVQRLIQQQDQDTLVNLEEDDINDDT